ncbi:MAG: 4-(cytidine 5'-diphospho)-2-C-methyl-D-erythritol kinase [Thermodesulfobacteriota bacterium]
MEIQAPAKINLFLDVLGKRTDGYHELRSLMCPIGIYDTVRLSCEPADAPADISVVCTHPDVPSGRANLAWSAASAFFAETGFSAKTTVAIDKRIPVGAGLGGGSSDAAAVLAGLNRFFDHPLSTDRLMTIGRCLGADVPFFIHGRPALATGIGEKLSPWPDLPLFHLVLIYPNCPVSTGEVYKKLNLALTKNKKITTKFTFESGWEADFARQLYNALEPPAMQLCPEIRQARQALMNSGALASLMSGSGSSVFGIFEDAGQAGMAFDALSARCHSWQVFQTRLLD